MHRELVTDRPPKSEIANRLLVDQGFVVDAHEFQRAAIKDRQSRAGAPRMFPNRRDPKAQCFVAHDRFADVAHEDERVIDPKEAGHSLILQENHKCVPPLAWRVDLVPSSRDAALSPPILLILLRRLITSAWTPRTRHRSGPDEYRERSQI